MRNPLRLTAAAWLLPLLLCPAGAMAAPAPPIPAGGYVVLPAESRVTILVRSTLHNFEVRARAPRGELTVPAVGGTGVIRLRLEFSSQEMDSGNDMRDTVMREDVLEIRKFPLILFEASEAAFAGEEKGTPQYRVRGILTLHGVRKELSIPVRLRAAGERLTAEATADLKISDHKMTVPSPLPFLHTEDTLTLTARLALKRRGN